MIVWQQALRIETGGRGFYNLTDEIAKCVVESKVKLGLATVFIQHTSASLIISENADPAVCRDLGRFAEKFAPDDSSMYEHDDEGPDDMPAHIRSAFTRTSEQIPISNRKMGLGTWQAIYLWEHRRAPHSRTVIVHISGV